jgi:hypothetical protein
MRRSLSIALFLALGCQTYDFQPVRPVSLGQTTTDVAITAKQLKPNLMLVLDRSGSMKLPFDATLAACGSCGQSGQPACDSSTCPTRWDVLTDTATDFLSSSGKTARMGVAFYPALSDATITDPGSGNSSNFCTAASSIDVGLPSSDDDSALQAAADSVDFAIKRVGSTASPLAGGVGGGTPTGDSLVYVAGHAGFGSTIQRQSFMLLMTDGLPNCNPLSGGVGQPPLNANVNPAACDCTDGASSTVCSYYPVLDCNDFNETAIKVSGIRSSGGVKTIVIGYGDVFGASAQKSLQQIALAGDFQRRCKADGSECDPSDTACFQESNPHLCAEQFFRATSKEQLSAALAAVTSAILQGNPCLVQLDPAPVDPTFLTVLVTEKGVTTAYPYPSDIWTFAPDGSGNATLTFNDPLCSKMKSASEDISYEIRSVHQL